MIVMTPDAGEAEIAAVRAKLETVGVHVLVLPGELTTAIGAIGDRNVQNYALREVAGKLGKPVLLKRGLSSSLDELLMAADYILKEGNPNVMLCERGIRTFETATRFTLDLSAVPWLKLHTHLPVIVDPSHASGDRRLVEPLARAAAAVGADGIIVEVHDDPEHALCDGPQALYARDFAAFAQHVGAHAALV